MWVGPSPVIGAERPKHWSNLDKATGVIVPLPPVSSNNARLTTFTSPSRGTISDVPFSAQGLLAPMQHVCENTPAFVLR